MLRNQITTLVLFFLILIVNAQNATSDYKEVKIGDQVWMAENLNVAYFANGDPIPEVKSKEEWVRAGKEGKPAWCYYNNDPANGKKYGKLYNWHAVNDPRGLAPKGWKIPSEQDWKELESFLGDPEMAAIKIKSKSWISDVSQGRNTTGFSALPSGSRVFYNGEFKSQGNTTGWWSNSISEDHKDKKWVHTRSLGSKAKIVPAWTQMGQGSSVRCIKTSANQEDPAIAKLKAKIEYKLKENRSSYLQTITPTEINDLAAVAESDIPWALENNLGLTLYELTDKHRDRTLATKWLKRQADHVNSAEAMFNWAMENSYVEKRYDTYNPMTFDALKVPENKEVCLAYMKKAAKLESSYNDRLYYIYDHYKMYGEAISLLKELVLIENDPKYAYLLSLKYRKGEGTPMDVNKANAMLRKAADAGYTSAMTAYGKRLFEGKDGLPLDATKGMNYLNASCEEGDCSACDYLVRNGITPTKRGSGCN